MYSKKDLIKVTTTCQHLKEESHLMVESLSKVIITMKFSISNNVNSQEEESIQLAIGSLNFMASTVIRAGKLCLVSQGHNSSA